jgi:NAD(P)H-hydrate epimerase
MAAWRRSQLELLKMMHRVEVTPLTTGQLRQMFQLMTDVHGIAPPQIVERIGQALARLARRLLDDDLTDRPIVVLAGQGVKGAAGLAAARHLFKAGAWVQTILVHPPEDHLMGNDQNEAAQQLARLRELDAPLAWAEEGWELPPADLVIDALIDVDEEGEPGEKVRNLIHLANSNTAPILSLDAPSGLDGATGGLRTPCVQAAATLALILPKRGLLIEPSRSMCGDLYLAGIDMPSTLYAQLGLDSSSFFSRDTIVTLAVMEEKAFIAEDAL